MTTLLSRAAIGAASIALICSLSSKAHAQNASGAAPTTTPGAATPPPATTAPPATNAAPATTTTPANGQPAQGVQLVTGPATQPEEDPSQKVRFRFAVHLLGGPWFVPSRTGGGGGAGLQLGVQINDMLGVYYSGTAAIGVAGSNGSTGSGASAGAFVYNSVMGDVTLANILQLGAGPSLDTMAFGSSDVSTSGSSSTALAGTYFGIQTRVGIAVGGSKPGKKGRFMLGLEVHPTFASGVVPISAFLTLGGGYF